MQKVEQFLEIEMAIDRKDVQILASNVAKVLMKSSFTFLKERPIASSTLLLFLLLYIFVPSIFWFLIYSLPFVVFIAITVRIYTSVRKAKDINKDENGSDCKSSRKIRFAEDDNKKYNSVHARSVRRRRAKETITEGYTQSSLQENGTIYMTRFTNDLVDKSALIEETPKEIREVEVESVINHPGCTSSNNFKGIRSQFHDDSFIGSQRFSGGAAETEGISSENTEDEDEDRRGDERKAVLWNEDDQKNLMDLGTSEIERNKRLESLIARRRARKLLSLQVRRTLMNMGGNDTSSLMASIMIPKHNPFLPGSSQFSPAPGSAPSVLLPMRNPFDLPYEPHEEKPNLTEDSFHQEFMVSHQKETMFCRHESFSLGAFLPGELKQDLHETSLYHDHGIKQVNSERPESCKSGSQLDQGNDEKVIKHRPSQEAESELKIEKVDDHVTVQAPEQGPDLVDIPLEEFDSEIQTKLVIVEDSNGRLSSPSSSEEDEPFCRIDKDAILKSLSSPAPRNIATNRESSGRIDDILYDYGPSTPEKTRREERIYYADKTMHHTPSHSIASDLQVEVSEVGSPPLTNDGNISSPDEKASICDGNIEKEVTSCSEDMWVASSHLSGVDKNESRSREIREVSEEDIIGVGFSRIGEKSGIPIASPLMAERVVEQDSIYPHSHSPSPSENEPPEESEAHTTFVNNSIHEQFQGYSPDFSQALIPEVLAFPLNGKVQQSTGSSLAHPSCSIDSENLEEPSQPTNISKEQSSTILSHPGPHLNGDTDNIETIQEIGDEDRELESQANIRGMLNTSNTSDSSSAEHISGQPGEPSDIRTVFEIKSSVEDNGNSRSSDKFKEDTEYLSESEHVAEKSRLVESNDIQDTKVSQSDGIASSSLPELGIAPIGTVSASSVFPDSLLQENAGMDQSYPSNAEKLMHVNIQESDTNMILHNECSVAPNESLKPRDAHNSLHQAWDSILQSSNGQNSSKRQLGIINNVDDSNILENDDQINLTTCKEVHIHLSTKQGRERTEMSETTCSKSFESHGSQFKGLVKPTTVSIYDKLVGESSKPTFSEETEGMSEKMPQQEEMITPIQANFVPESSNDTENERHSAVGGTSRVSQDISDPPEVEVMPDAVNERVPTALGSSLSPKSVLQPNFSMDLSSVSSLSHEVQMEIQQSDRYTIENNTLDERGSSSSSLTPIQSAGPLMENRNVDTIQNSSTLSMLPTEEANCIEVVNELVVHDEEMQITKPGDFPKDTAGSLSSHGIIAELAKPTVDTNSIFGKNDDMPGTSTSSSNTADKLKNFDIPLTNEQDNMMQLAFSFWTNVISGPEENEKEKKEKRHQSKPSTNDQLNSQSSGRLSSHEILAELTTPTMDTNSILRKNDDMPETSTSYSKTADKQKNFDMR